MTALPPAPAGAIEYWNPWLDRRPLDPDHPSHWYFAYPGAALATGIIFFALGIRMKVKEHHPLHGRVLRDVGRAIAGPGYVGVLVGALLSYHGALIVRRTTRHVSAVERPPFPLIPPWDLYQSLHPA